MYKKHYNSTRATRADLSESHCKIHESVIHIHGCVPAIKNVYDKRHTLEQGSGTYGSSGDGIWLPDNFELKKKKSPPATL